MKDRVIFIFGNNEYESNRHAEINMLRGASVDKIFGFVFVCYDYDFEHDLATKAWKINSIAELLADGDIEPSSASFNKTPLTGRVFRHMLFENKKIKKFGTIGESDEQVIFTNWMNKQGFEVSKAPLTKNDTRNEILDWIYT